MASSVKRSRDVARLPAQFRANYNGAVPVPLLTCLVCAKQTALPYRTLKGTSLPEPYWPEEENLALVCDECGHYQQFTRLEVDWGAKAEGLEGRGFWRVEIPCSRPRCPATILAHVQTFGLTSRSTIGVAIAVAQPTPQCRLHHGPNPIPYPIRIDFVEWAGKEEYVV
jgi:hypothetical protein